MLKQMSVAALIALIAAPPAALAETLEYGSFRFNTETPTVAVLAGPIAHHTPIDFHRMVDKHPGIRYLGLDSPGGDVSAGLILALAVDDLGINTQIPEGRSCFSACAYVFLAGKSRQMNGTIGVHMPKPVGEFEGWRETVEADIRYVLAKLDVPIWIFDGILNTPNDQIRTYSASEAAEIGLNR